MKISIIIVNFNSGDYLSRCLNSIVHNVIIDYEIIVVDNSSSDDSLQQCESIFNTPNIKCIKLKENVGFAKANNIGANVSKGNMLHFLNPDTEVKVDINDDYNHCILYPHKIYVNRLENPDGSIVKSKHIIITLGNLFKFMYCKKKVSPWFIGATLMISKENFYRIGQWNESFFMYAEDLDLFYKASLFKIEVEYLKSIIFHVGGGSSSKVWNSLEREIRVQNSFKKFYEINNIKRQYVLYKIIVFLISLSQDYNKSKILLEAWKKNK